MVSPIVEGVTPRRYFLPFQGRCLPGKAVF
jgi:hypothetical protein